MLTKHVILVLLQPLLRYVKSSGLSKLVALPKLSNNDVQRTCRKLEAKVETQLMAALPPPRLQSCTPPFLYSTMDYFGPINVKVSRNESTKHYGVIFTCMNTRAIHCELATDASATELLQVLRRFFSYRGYPKLL